MSQFPKRLIDELGEGDARRLLERGRSEEPPARLVAAAILTATKSTSAAEDAPASSVRASGAGSRGSKTALVAGAFLLGVAAIVGGRELQSREATTSTSTSTAPEPSEGRTTNDDSRPPVADMVGTAVADLPDAPAPRTPAPTAPRAETKRAEQTADLLREANRLRARGQWAEAAATYQKVIDLGPDSAEAYPADVALGNLELQQNHPLPALSRYEHALGKHPNGALSEEARWGKARALRAAGRTAEERAALEEFRKHHPDSPLAPVAEQRLADIGN